MTAPSRSIAIRPRAVRAPSRALVAKATVPPFGKLVGAMLIVRPSLDFVLGEFRFSVGPLSITPGFLFNALMIAIAGLLSAHAVLIDRRGRGALTTGLSIWGPFLAISAIALTQTPSAALAPGIQIYISYLTYASVSLIALFYAPSVNRSLLIRGVALSAVGPLLVGLVKLVTGTAGDRLQASFTHPNILAFFLMTVTGFLYHALVSQYPLRRWERRAIWALLVVALIELLLTGTRSAYVATFAFLLVYSALRKPLYLLPLLLSPPLALLVPGVMARVMDATQGAPPMSYAYLVSVAHGEIDGSRNVEIDSGTWRRYLWASAWPWVQNNPWRGYGLSSFAALSSQFFELGTKSSSGAHNVYLQTLFEGGVPLFFTFLWILFAPIALVLVKSADYGEKIFVVVIMISFAVVSYSDNMLGYLSSNVEMLFIVFVIIGREFRVPRALNSKRDVSIMLQGARNFRRVSKKY